jgi:hypothetical protein
MQILRYNSGILFLDLKHKNIFILLLRIEKKNLYISHRIAGVLDFIHRPDFNSKKKKEEQTRRFGNWICFRPHVRGDTYSVGSVRKS